MDVAVDAAVSDCERKAASKNLARRRALVDADAARKNLRRRKYCVAVEPTGVSIRRSPFPNRSHVYVIRSIASSPPNRGRCCPRNDDKPNRMLRRLLAKMKSNVNILEI